MKPGLIRFKTSNFRGIVELVAEPNGRSLTLRGKNGSGKSSAIDALFWALGGQLPGEVVRNGADRAEVELVFGDYLVRRTEARGKPPKLTVKRCDDGATLAKPTEVLSGFVGAIERQTFSTRKPAQQAEILRQLAPGLDCSDLDETRRAAYERRTEANREGNVLRAQAAGIDVPEAPDLVENEIDLAEVAGRKAEVERVRASNAEARRLALRKRTAARDAVEMLKLLDQQIEALQEHRRVAAEKEESMELMAQDHERSAAALVDPDAGEIEHAIAAAREHNLRVREQQQRAQATERAKAERERLEKQANAKKVIAAGLTGLIDDCDEEKRKRLAAATLPVPGLSLSGEVVTFDDGEHGAVDLAALNSAGKILVDIAIAQALGHRLIAIREASLLDQQHWQQVVAFANERGIQLLSEVVGEQRDLVVEIVEGAEDGDVEIA